MPTSARGVPKLKDPKAKRTKEKPVTKTTE
jgi:hypothetical protein